MTTHTLRQWLNLVTPERELKVRSVNPYLLLKIKIRQFN